MNHTTNDTEKTQIKVAEVIDRYKLVINKGLNAGIKKEQRFLVYIIGDEIFDPDTKESLGNLDIIRGTGRVVHLQDSMATIESDMIRHIHRSIRDGFSTFKYMGGEETIYETEKIPFENPSKGDLVKPV